MFLFLFFLFDGPTRWVLTAMHSSTYPSRMPSAADAVRYARDLDLSKELSMLSWQLCALLLGVVVLRGTRIGRYILSRDSCPYLSL